MVLLLTLEYDKLNNMMIRFLFNRFFKILEIYFNKDFFCKGLHHKIFMGSNANERSPKFFLFFLRVIFHSQARF